MSNYIKNKIYFPKSIKITENMHKLLENGINIGKKKLYLQFWCAEYQIDSAIFCVL